MKPLVSLVTPVYNAMPYFKEYLECVKKQTWRPLEFIVVDDGSKDDSWTYIQESMPAFQATGIKVHALKREHEGQAAAINSALPFITGEYFAWCDADDLMTPDSIEKKTEYLISHKELGMVRSNGIHIDDNQKKRTCNAKDADGFTQNVFDALFHNTTYCYAGCYMLRTSLFFECYPEKQIPLSIEGQNLQLLLPPASRTDCGYIPEILHYYHQRRSGHSSKGQSYKEKLSRIKNFASLRREILNYCICEQQYYIKENEVIERREKEQLNRLAVIYVRERLRNT